jgi:hypothetical protein
VLSGKATNTNLIVFGSTRLGFKPTIYRTTGEHLRKISFLYIFKNNTMFYRLSSENVWQRKKKEKQQQNFLFIATEKHIVGVIVHHYFLKSAWRYQRVIRISISKKNRQHNGQKKMYKKTNNDQKNIHIKLKIE